MKIKKIKALNRIKSHTISIDIPGSKSITNRALLIASLAKGKSTINNALLSDDTKYMILGLKQFGIKIIQNNESIIVYGNKHLLKEPKKSIFVGNAGTAMRFLTGLAALVNGKTTITGSKRMQQRPIKYLLEGLKQLGITSKDNKGCPPVTIFGNTFKKNKIILNGRISSQYLSSLLMVGPYIKNGLTIIIKNNLVSKPYIDITLKVMKQFGVKVTNKNYKYFYVTSNPYKQLNFRVEPDASNASYFFAAAAITKCSVQVNNLSLNSIQGDIQFIKILEKMGCTVQIGRNWIKIKGKKLNGIDIDMNKMPDMVQTLAVVALFAQGPTIIRNIGNLRVKETDRIRALSTELRKIGAIVYEYKDSIKILPKELKPTEIETYDDHRMAMSFAIAGLNIEGIRIKDPNCVRKSFPGFWKVLNKLYQ